MKLKVDFLKQYNLQNTTTKDFYPVNFFAHLPSVEISSLTGLGRWAAQALGAGRDTASTALLGNPDTRNHLSQLSALAVITSPMTSITWPLIYVMGFWHYRVNNGLRLPGLIVSQWGPWRQWQSFFWWGCQSQCQSQRRAMETVNSTAMTPGSIIILNKR